MDEIFLVEAMVENNSGKTSYFEAISNYMGLLNKKISKNLKRKVDKMFVDEYFSYLKAYLHYGFLSSSEKCSLETLRNHILSQILTKCHTNTDKMSHKY
jgi:hypothetical protein